jgi:malonyl-CoA decarboxylase
VALRRALTPRFADLLHLLTGLSGGVKLLVDLRADLRQLLPDELPMVELELEGHLATVFDVGLLRLERITWGSPARLLEKLIEYEAVHEIDGWDDLRDRLDLDRRCFAFLHPAMPDEPVVFVEIALVQGTPTALSELLDRDAPRQSADDADTAVFYSITSCQPGLAGINLGNELLKTVVRELRRELANLTRFVTLSPIPTLRSAELDLPAPVRERLDGLGWLDGDDADVRAALLPAVARYLTTSTGGRVADPVANFHLSNGARVDALRWRANTEGYGLDRSWGVMASYRYDPGDIAANAAAYAAGEAVAASDEITALAAR